MLCFFKINKKPEPTKHENAFIEREFIFIKTNAIIGYKDKNA